MSDVFSGAPENCDAAAERRAAEEENTKGRERYDGGRSDRGQCYHSRWDFPLSLSSGRTEEELHHHIGIGFFSAAAAVSA